MLENNVIYNNEVPMPRFHVLDKSKITVQRIKTLEDLQKLK